MIHSRECAKIRRLHKEGLSVLQIQKSFPRKVITLNEITNILKSYRRLKWTIEGDKKYLVCNTCGNKKEYNYDNFQITDKSHEKKCRSCRNLERKNKRKIKSNMGIKDLKDLHNTRRWRRLKLIRIIDPDFYKTTYKPKYIIAGKDLNYFRGRKKNLLNK